MIAEVREGDKRYREEKRSVRSVIDNAGEGSSHDLEDRANRSGPRIR